MKAKDLEYPTQFKKKEEEKEGKQSWRVHNTLF